MARASNKPANTTTALAQPADPATIIDPSEPVPASPDQPADAAGKDDTATNDNPILRLALAEVDGYTLIPAGSIKGNHTVEEVEPRIEHVVDGVKMVVAKHIAK